jgi:hypothetical protein
VSIWGLSWPWRTKKGRTVESYDKIGRRRVLCIAGGSPVTGDIEVQQGREYRLAGDKVESRLNGLTSRWTRCPECDCKIRVTGSKSKPRLTVHNGVDKYGRRH